MKTSTISDLTPPQDYSQVEQALAAELSEFIDHLKVHSGTKPLDLLVSELATLKPTRELMNNWISFDSDLYKRNLVYRDDDFEILVLNWMSGQRSPIHNHKGSACAVYVIEGIGSEIAFERSPLGLLYPISTQHFERGSVCGSYDQDIHQIVNLQPAQHNLISMHIYSPPLKNMETFPLSESTFADYDQLMTSAVSREIA
jgi:cysteine dioxygenase